MTPEGIDASAAVLHDLDCNDGDTRTCERWCAGINPKNMFYHLHVGHVNYYRDLAIAVLRAADLRRERNESASKRSERPSMATFYVCVPDYGTARIPRRGFTQYSEGEYGAPVGSEGWICRFGDDREPAEALAVFMDAVVNDEWASIYYSF